MFTIPCYINKNTPELREKLDALGYYSRVTQPKMDGSNSGVLFCNNGRYSETPFGHPEEINRTIDCGENEDLFFSLAALRDDIDDKQWFVMDVEVYVDIPKGTWFKATNTDGGKHIGTQIDPVYCHKATVEEIIEKFKVENVEDK